MPEPTQENLVKLSPRVELVRRDNTLILMRPDIGATVRVSKGAEALIPEIEEGTDYESLVTQLKKGHPTAINIRPTLDKFLSQLSRNNLLIGDQAEVKSKGVPRFVLFYPDRAAAATARVIQRIPAMLSWCLLVSVISSAIVGLVIFFTQSDVLHPSKVAEQFNLFGFLAFALIVVPIHEAAHAIACRLAGAKVGEAGIIMHGWIVPGPYIETTQAYSINDKFKRFWIPAAGPIVNLCSAGVAAWVMILTPGLSPAELAAWSYLLVLCMLFVYLDTSLFTASDGSHMLEALLEDELARKSALSAKPSSMSSTHTTRIYRLACLAHLILGIVAMWYWWVL